MKTKEKAGGTLTSTEQQHQKDLQRLRDLRPIDDDFMRCLFKDNIPLAEFVLRIITDKPDLVITGCETQKDMKRLAGARSICLDAYGTDSAGKKYDLDYSDFRFIPINLSKDHFHETSIQVCRNNYSNNLAQAGR